VQRFVRPNMVVFPAVRVQPSLQMPARKTSAVQRALQRPVKAFDFSLRLRVPEIANGRSVPALGPYPERGEYEHCFTLEGPHGEFVQLTATVAEHIARAIEWSRNKSRVARREAVDARADREERAYDEHAYAVLDDTVSALHAQPFVCVA